MIICILKTQDRKHQCLIRPYNNREKTIKVCKCPPFSTQHGNDRIGNTHHIIIFLSHHLSGKLHNFCLITLSQKGKRQESSKNCNKKQYSLHDFQYWI